MKYNIFILDKQNEIVKLGQVDGNGQEKAEESVSSFFNHMPTQDRIKVFSVTVPFGMVQEKMRRLIPAQT